MNAIKAVQGYIEKFTTSCSGMKVLLLDDDTTKFISTNYTQTQLLEKEIYLVDKIYQKRQKMKHLKCICFLRPTEASLKSLLEELKDPPYGEYYICNLILTSLFKHDTKNFYRKVSFVNEVGRSR